MTDEPNGGTVATGRDEPRLAATEMPGDALKIEPTTATTGDDNTRHVATVPQPEKKSEEGRGADARVSASGNGHPTAAVSG